MEVGGFRRVQFDRSVSSRPRLLTCLDPQSGQQIYPGYEPGTEAEPGAWSIWIVGNSEQSLFGNTFFGQAVHEQAK